MILLVQYYLWGDYILDEEDGVSPLERGILRREMGKLSFYTIPIPYIYDSVSAKSYFRGRRNVILFQPSVGNRKICQGYVSIGEDLSV